MRQILKSVTLAVVVLVCSNPAVAGSPRVLFDQGHGQLFFIDREAPLDLSRLAVTFSQAGFSVDSSAVPLTSSLLAQYDALILSGAFESPDANEIAAIKEFINRGGKLAVMLHVGPLVVPLLNSLNVSVSSAVLHDTQWATNNTSSDFPITSLAGHLLFDQMKGFNLYGAWGLNPNDASVGIMAITQPSAWLDMNRNQVKGNNPQGRFPVIVRGPIGLGEFLVFGDDAIFQNQFLVGNNLQLAKNLAQWMLP